MESSLANGCKQIKGLNLEDIITVVKSQCGIQERNFRIKCFSKYGNNTYFLMFLFHGCRTFNKFIKNSSANTGVGQ